MKRRVISLILVLSMVLSISLPTITMAEDIENLPKATNIQEDVIENPFIDVNKDNWYYDGIMYSLKNDIFGGTELNSFSPDETMTRGMYMTVMGRIAEINIANYTGNSGFNDVNESDYFSPYIAWAAQMGITKGTSKDSFSPNAFVTREEMAVLTVNFFDVYGVAYPEKTVGTKPKDLESISSWAKGISYETLGM